MDSRYAKDRVCAPAFKRLGGDGDGDGDGPAAAKYCGGDGEPAATLRSPLQVAALDPAAWPVYFPALHSPTCERTP